MLRLLAIFAHPDDESLAVGGTLARYAAEGIDTYLLTATRGERGRYFTNENRPSDTEVGQVREGELADACAVLGIKELHLLDYLDGELDKAPADEAVGRIARVIRRVRPQVVITFDPFGAYGHPDHIAISQFAAAATVAAADPHWRGGAEELVTFGVSKLYYTVNDSARWNAHQSAFKRLVSRVDGVEREAIPWPDWSITTRIDTRAFAAQTWQAVQCHKTQLAVYQALENLTAAQHDALWGEQTFYRVFSAVNSGRDTETDLFEGLR